MSALREERGSATIVGCFLMAALVVVTATLVHVGSAVASRHRAQAAADLAALAVAVALDRGSEQACGQAERIATRMRVRVRACTVDGWDAIVEVAAEVTTALPGAGEAVAIARAGPAGQALARAVSTAPSSAIAPALSSGSLPLPHLGE